jgi:hypothetical protein
MVNQPAPDSPAPPTEWEIAVASQQERFVGRRLLKSVLVARLVLVGSLVLGGIASHRIVLGVLQRLRGA